MWQQNRTPQANTKEMVTGDLPNRQFKIVVLKGAHRIIGQRKNKDNSQ